MKTKFSVVISLLFLLISCSNDDAFPKVENITNGKKWTLEIGKTPLEVYSQLQELGLAKQFNSVAVLYRQAYTKPEDIQSDISLYNSITLQTTSGDLQRVLISFDETSVISIEKGGGLLYPIQKWPENQTDDFSINIADSVDIIKEKLIAIYQIPSYQEYQLILPDKLLTKPFDIDMTNYEEWAFTFSKNISSSKEGRNSVHLYFKNTKLFKIRNVYEEFDFVN